MPGIVYAAQTIGHRGTIRVSLYSRGPQFLSKASLQWSLQDNSSCWWWWLWWDHNIESDETLRFSLFKCLVFLVLFCCKISYGRPRVSGLSWLHVPLLLIFIVTKCKMVWFDQPKEMLGQQTNHHVLYDDEIHSFKICKLKNLMTLRKVHLFGKYLFNIVSQFTIIKIP